MRAYSKFAESYGSVQVTTGVATADNIQLIQMLFDGLLESLAMAFLGTLLAALVALPLSLLGAGNIIGNVLLVVSGILNQVCKL